MASRRATLRNNIIQKYLNLNLAEKQMQIPSSIVVHAFTPDMSNLPHSASRVSRFPRYIVISATIQFKSTSR